MYVFFNSFFFLFNIKKKRKFNRIAKIALSSRWTNTIKIFRIKRNRWCDFLVRRTEKKNSIWKKCFFYISVSVALSCSVHGVWCVFVAFASSFFWCHMNGIFIIQNGWLRSIQWILFVFKLVFHQKFSSVHALIINWYEGKAVSSQLFREAIVLSTVIHIRPFAFAFQAIQYKFFFLLLSRSLVLLLRLVRSSTRLSSTWYSYTHT